MADRIYVIYASTLGTSTARPVLEYYTEDETHTPDVTLLGYTTATAGWVRLTSLDVLASSDDSKEKLFVNPSTSATSTTNVSRSDITHAQTQVLGKIADLIAQWKWTQELEARITKATQAAFANWINSLENIPSNSLWSTDPAAITLPATPSVTAHPDPVSKQISAAGWTDDAAMSSQKLGVSNPGTMQLVWGFDTDDLSVFGRHVRVALGWSVGRSGHRALLASASAGAVQTVWVTPGVLHSFAMAPGDTFYIEAWVRGTAGLPVNVGLTGFSDRTGQAIPYNGGDGQATVVANPTTWTRISGYVQVPSGNPIRWGSVEFTFGAGASSVWIEIDQITVTRVPRIPNSFVQATTQAEVTYTGTVATSAQEVLTLPFFRGGNGATVQLNTTARIIPANLSSDAMRMQFFLTVEEFGTGVETLLMSWLEYSNGANNYRNTYMSWTDPTGNNLQVIYRLRVSKLGSVNTMSLGSRHLNAILLPRL